MGPQHLNPQACFWMPSQPKDDDDKEEGEEEEEEVEEEEEEGMRVKRRRRKTRRNHDDNYDAAKIERDRNKVHGQGWTPRGRQLGFGIN